MGVHIIKQKRFEDIYRQGVQYGGFDASEQHSIGVSLPVWEETLTRNAGNPVITDADVAGSTFVADPHLIVIEDTLYCFLEAHVGANGEIWMAESTDGTTWTNFQKVSDAAIHFSHPQAMVYNNRIYVFYNNNLDNGHIYYRSSPITGFPVWSAEAEALDVAVAGWTRCIEFAIFEHNGLWYLFGVASDESANSDQRLMGMYATHFTVDWNTDGVTMRTPLLDIQNTPWVNQIVEVTPLIVGDRLYLTFGARRTSDSVRGIGVLAITELSPDKFSATWLADDLTLPPTGAGWETNGIHRLSAVPYKENWVVAFDGLNGAVYEIGFATMPLKGTATDSLPSGVPGATVERPNYKSLVALIHSSKFFQIPTNAGWTAAVTGSGATTQAVARNQLETGVTASSTARLYVVLSGFAQGGDNYDKINWDKPFTLIFTYGRYNSDAQAVARVQLKTVNTEGALGAMGIGLRVDNLALVGESYGTGLGTVALVSLTSSRDKEIMIQHDPSVPEIRWYVDGLLIGRQTDPNNIPSGMATSILVHSIINGVAGGVNAVSNLWYPIAIQGK